MKLMSSRPSGLRHRKPTIPRPTAGRELAESTMAQHLQAARHVTDAIGKWHLGSEAQFHPLSRGFDEFFGFFPGATSYLPEPGGKSILLRNREPAPQTQSDQFGSEAMAFAESHRAEPWLLYLAFNARHTPLEAPPEWLARVVAPQKGRSVSSASTKTRAAVSAAKSSMQ